MSALDLLHRGHIGFESRILGRRAHHADPQAEPLEGRQLLSAGHVGVAPGSVVNPTTADQANVPTDNSSSTNTASVSPMQPATLNVETDDSPSVTTSASASVSALNPDTTSALDTASDEPVVYLVQSPIPATTIELSIDTPGLLQSINSPLNLQSINAPAGFQSINAPVSLHAINAPVSVQPSITPIPVPNGPPTVIQHIGQSIGTDVQRRFHVHVGPDPDETSLIDQLEPLQPFQQPKAEPPKGEPSKIDLPKPDLPMDQTPPAKQAIPLQDVPPVTLPPVRQPADGGTAPAAPGALSPEAAAPIMNPHTSPSTLFGVTAIIGGGYYLAMRESERFSMPWPQQPASARSRMLLR